MMKGKFQPDRARAIGRMLFQKYDLGKRGALGPKQCYEIFSDFCYRILAIQPQPTMEEANSMYEILDQNKDKKVTESDFQNLAMKFLCGQSSNIGSSFNFQSNSSSSQIGSNTTKTANSNLQTSNVTTYKQTRNTLNINPPSNPSKNLTVIAKKRLDVARRLFKLFDKDESGFLTEDEVPYIIEETYRQMGQNYKPSKSDVASYMKMVDTNRDGQISLNQFQQIILRSLKNAGFQIYQ